MTSTNTTNEMGKILVYIGLLLVILGLLYHYVPNLFSWFGRLPGDIRVERESGSFYFPVVSMIIISIVLTVLLNLFFRR